MVKLADGTHLYPVRNRQRYGERPGFKITELILEHGQEVPWHRHTTVIDTFYVIEGTLRVAATEPSQEVVLGPTQVFQVRAGRPHRVTSAGAAPTRFLVIGDAQGAGLYDFEPVAASGDTP